MSYEIAVACDVSLGAVISESSHAKTIDIDPDAVRAVLFDVLSLETDLTEPRELLVVAKHFDSLQTNRNKGIHVLGNFVPARKAESGIPVINVAVAGDPWNFTFPNPEKFVDSIASTIENGGDMKQAVKDLKDIAVVEPISADDTIQATVVHELSHAADDLNPKARKESVRYHSKNFALKLGTYLLTNAAVLVALDNAENGTELTINPVALAVAQSTLAMLGGLLTVRAVSRTGHEQYLASPEEIRARKLEEVSADYPQIITIQ